MFREISNSIPNCNRIFIKLIIKLRNCNKISVTCNCIKLQLPKTLNYSIKKYLLLPVFLFVSYKWLFRCCTDLIENRRRFDQIFGPYQDYKGIFNIIIYHKNE